MEKKYLIPWSEFIDNEINPNCLAICEMERSLIDIHKYKNLITQPINLEQFIACDLKGNFLEEPKRFGHFKNYGQFGVIKGNELKLCKEYKEAQERVLFKGFEYKIEVRNSGGNNTHFIYNGKIEIHLIWGGLYLDGSKELKTLEDLTHFNLELK